MTPLAPHITAFLRERLPVERRASVHTCETYAHAFRLLFEYAASTLKTTPSQLHLEQIDAPLAAIKSFMHFVEYRVPSALEQVRQIFAIPTKKTDTRLVRHLTRDEI